MFSAGGAVGRVGLPEQALVTWVCRRRESEQGGWAVQEGTPLCRHGVPRGLSGHKDRVELLGEVRSWETWSWYWEFRLPRLAGEPRRVWPLASGRCVLPSGFEEGVCGAPLEEGW